MKIALRVGVAVCATVSAAAAQITVTNLGAPGNAPSSRARAISNSGYIAMSTDRPSNGFVRAPDGSINALVIPAGFTNGAMVDINDAGVGIGTVSTGDPDSNILIRRASNGLVTVISPPAPYTRTEPGAIRADGTFCGSLNGGAVAEQAFVYNDATGMTLIPRPAGTSRGSAAALNDLGEVVGSVAVASRSRPYRYTPGVGSALLPTPGDTTGDALSINNAGIVVGSYGGLGAPVRGARWDSASVFSPLPNPPGSAVTSALSINTRGDIVGVAYTGDARAVAWTDDFGTVDLNDLLTPEDQAHWNLQFAHDINDVRQIVGFGRFDPDGEVGPLPSATRAFLLSLPPVPEPTAAAILGGTLPVLLKRTPRIRRQLVQPLNA